MINRFLPLLLFLFGTVKLAAVEAAISYAIFQSPDQAYLELYLRIDGKHISFHPVSGDSLQQARADIAIQFFANDQEVLSDRFRVSSPLTSVPVDFIALQRYPLPAGAYELILELSDAADPEDSRRYRAAPEVRFVQDSLAQSDISLLAGLQTATTDGPLVRNGIQIEPLPNRYYGPESERLYFYHEIYHADRFIGEDFVLTYAVESLQNGSSKRIMERHKRQAPQAIISQYAQLNIRDLPSGHYQLLVEIRDRKKKLIRRSFTFFQRSNPGLWQEEAWLATFDPSESFVGDIPDDSLSYSLRALSPILPSTDMESVNWLLKQDDKRALRAFLLAYWSENAGESGQTAYREYMAIARAVDQQFHSGFRYGFETDRGYIYLKYGRPTEIEARENEPSAPPYEIWIYDRLPATQQNNVRFVFYNPSLAPGDYRLLHSTARGELQQPNWQRILYRNAPNETNGDDFLEGTEVIDNFHRSSRRIFGEGGG